MIKIHKEVYGQGKSIVLIHGWAMHTGIWRKFAQQLAQHYQVTCLDLPGHGLSETVEPYTLENISNALIEEVPESPFCLLGWSFGATVALAMADCFPQRINLLILLAGNPRFVQEGEWAGVSLDMLESFASSLQADCQLTLMRFLALQVNGLPEGKAILKALKNAIQECDPPSEKVLKAGLELLKTVDLRDQLSSLNCPVSVIQGDKDTLIPVEVSQNIQKIQPASEMNIISGAGHVPFLSHQSQVIEIINRFL
jgi:pimeloyl-[acyl-carrier protein] methyl ester esterase